MPDIYPSTGEITFDQEVSAVAAEALTAYKIVEYVNGDQIQLLAAQGNRPAGVTIADVAAGESGVVVAAGRRKVELAATIAAGALIAGNTAGEGIEASAGEWAVGVLLEGGDDGDLGVVHLFPTPILVDPTAVENAIVGVAAGYRIARGVASITGSGTVVTGLTTVVAVVATAQSDLDGDTLMAVSATIGDQAGAPAAGSVILKAWKSNGDGDATMVAADAAKSLNWLAIGT